MFNFKKPNKPTIRLCLGQRKGDELIYRDWLDWPENLPVPRVGEYVHRDTNLRAQVMWIDYDYTNCGIDIHAGISDNLVEANRIW